MSINEILSKYKIDEAEHNKLLEELETFNLGLVANKNEILEESKSKDIVIKELKESAHKLEVEKAKALGETEQVKKLQAEYAEKIKLEAEEKHNALIDRIKSSEKNAVVNKLLAHSKDDMKAFAQLKLEKELDISLDDNNNPVVKLNGLDVEEYSKQMLESDEWKAVIKAPESKGVEAPSFTAGNKFNDDELQVQKSIDQILKNGGII